MSWQINQKEKKNLFFWDQLEDKKVTNKVMVHFPFPMNNSTKNMSQYCVNLTSQTCQAYSKLKATSMVASTFMGMASSKFSILMFTYKILKTAPHFIQASFGRVVFLLVLITESFGKWASLFYQLRNIVPNCQYIIIL